MPQLFLQAWPWQITPLLARVFAGWYFLGALFLLTTGLSLRQAHEIPVAYSTLAAWNLLSLLLVPIYPESVRAGLGLWIWLIAHGGLLIFSSWATFRVVMVMHLEQQSL